jgi:methylthioxylose transferase
MTSATPTPAAPPARRVGRAALAPGIGLAVGLVLMAVAVALPAVTGWDVHVRWWPPLHAEWDPRVGIGTIPALLLGGLALRYAAGLAERLAWRPLLAASYAAGLGWMLALALVDGVDGIGEVLNHPYEYLNTARITTDFPATLREFVDRIPYAAEPDNWPVHVAGHPPGALGFFVVLDRLGLSSGLGAGLVVTLAAASTAVAVLVTMRLLGAEADARRAAPFLVIGPAAIWQCVSGDALFAAVAAWGMAALTAAAVGSGTRRWVWSIAAGLLLGSCMMLSYGLPLLGLLAVTILLLARSWQPLLPTAVVAAAVVLAFVPLGFTWWEALPVLQERYWDGVAHNRPPEYWMWANLAALLFSAGPMAAAAVAQAAARWRADAHRVATRLAAAGVGMVLLADLSQMSRAEVERIWLPFVPWILLATAGLPTRWRRWGLAIQVVTALLVQHLLFTGW